MTETVQSADGTTIAYERTGTGPAVILIGGAFNDRHSPSVLAAALSAHFTVFSYDRRGRGDSGDTLPFAVAREAEDLDALTAVAGGSALVYGHSSGAVLALEAAAAGVPITRLAVYEPPYTFDPESTDPPSDGAARIQSALDAGDREQAAEIFMTMTGMDVGSIEWVKGAPFWPGMVALAHTLPYDLVLCGDGTVPAERLAAVATPTLAIFGGTSPTWAGRAVAGVVEAMPDARLLKIDGQDHAVDLTVLAPVLLEFFGK